MLKPVLMTASAMIMASLITSDGNAQRKGANASITLYDGPNYSGQSVHIDSDVNNLKRLGFNDRASSIQVGAGRWEVCIHSDFGGSCQVVDSDIPDMTRWAFNDRITSVRKVRRETNRRGRRRGVTLYSGRNFSGQAIDITEHTTNLTSYNFNDAAYSIEVHSGTWTLCDHKDFGGRCEKISDSVRNLSRIGLNGEITSLTPRDLPRRDPNYGHGYSGGYGSTLDRNGGVIGNQTVFFPEPTINGYPIASCLDDSSSRCGRSVAERICKSGGYRGAVYYDESTSYNTMNWHIGRETTDYSNSKIVDLLCKR